jgi:hypothetical protein
MCRFGRLPYQRLGNECIDPSIINGAWRAWPGRVEQSIKSLLEKTRTPFCYCLRRDAKRVGYDFVAGAAGAAQNDARAQGERLSLSTSSTGAGARPAQIGCQAAFPGR